MPIKDKKNASKPTAAGVGLKPENFIEGGGLYSDFDGKLLELSFVEWDYDSKYDPSLFLAVEILNTEIDEEKDKNPFIQYYSCGSLDDFVPSEDGKEAVPVGSKTGLSKSTNGYIFLMSMIEAGFPPESVENRVDVFEGTIAHMVRQAQPERKGLKKDATKSTNDREKQILLAESIVALPGEEPEPDPVPRTAPKKGMPSAAAVAKASASASANTKKVTPISKKKGHGIPEDVADQAYGYIGEKLASNGSELSRDGLAKDVFKWAKENGVDIKMRNAVLQAVGNEDFLSADNDYFTFDGDTLTLKAE